MLYEITTDTYDTFEAGQEYQTICQEIFGIKPTTAGIEVLKERLAEYEMRYGHTFMTEAVMGMLPDALRMPFAVTEFSEVYEKSMAGRWHNHLLDLTKGAGVHFFKNESMPHKSFWAWRVDGNTRMVSKELLITLANICNGADAAFEVRCLK